MGTYLVQEITVMGYNDDSIFKVDQKFFQPCDGIQIQVVGRLVQKQNIRVSEQCLSKQDFDLLGTDQVFHHGIVKLRLDSKTI